jgi:hypothetical protein
MFSLTDVLDMVSEWLERNPAQLASSHFAITVHRSETSAAREMFGRLAAAARAM